MSFTPFQNGIVLDAPSLNTALWNNTDVPFLELGSLSTGATTPYIDFHTIGTPINDYDARIIVAGGTRGINNNGTLTMTAGFLNISANSNSANPTPPLLQLNSTANALTLTATTITLQTYGSPNAYLQMIGNGVTLASSGNNTFNAAYHSISSTANTTIASGQYTTIYGANNTNYLQLQSSGGVVISSASNQDIAIIGQGSTTVYGHNNTNYLQCHANGNIYLQSSNGGNAQVSGLASSTIYGNNNTNWLQCHANGNVYIQASGGGNVYLNNSSIEGGIGWKVYQTLDYGGSNPGSFVFTLSPNYTRFRLEWRTLTPNAAAELYIRFYINGSTLLSTTADGHPHYNYAYSSNQNGGVVNTVTSQQYIPLSPGSTTGHTFGFCEFTSIALKEGIAHCTGYDSSGIAFHTTCAFMTPNDGSTATGVLLAFVSQGFQYGDCRLLMGN